MWAIMRCATRDEDADDDADDDGVGADEILSSDDDGLAEYLKDADELVMSPLANVSNRTEMTCEATSLKTSRYRMMTYVLLGTWQRKLLHRRQLARR